MAEIESKLQQLGIEILEGAIDRGEYFSVKEAAEMLSCTTKTIRNRIERKELKAVYHLIGIGQSQYLIPKKEINVAATTTEVVAVSRSVSLAEIRASIKAEMQEENALLRSENAVLRAEIQEIKESQGRIEKLLVRSLEKPVEAVPETQKPWWKFW